MTKVDFEQLLAEVKAIRVSTTVGRVVQIGKGLLQVSGLSQDAAIGDLVRFEPSSGAPTFGEVIKIEPECVEVLPDHSTSGFQINDRVCLLGAAELAPDDSWIGRVIDPLGQPLDGRPIMRGLHARSLEGLPTNPTTRRPMGERLETGLTVFNTFLPIVRGQRIGLFAGSGVGKSTLLAKLARGVHADVVVIALIGERGREVREFIDRVLGKEGMKRAVVVAATSDKSPMMRRRCAMSAMTIAEHFRDLGHHVLFLADSVTRFAEAHREIALASGERGNMRGFPPSTAQQITTLCERAGPGTGAAGDISAIFSVLVAGADMDEPIADILRGVLDGHVVLDRRIAERGRFPAIDLLRSVSRSLPEAASDEENSLIAMGRRLLGAYDRSELMIQAGLYNEGSDEVLDEAIETWPKLDAFLTESATSEDSFNRLAQCLPEKE